VKVAGLAPVGLLATFVSQSTAVKILEAVPVVSI